jgi:hypothetical protein
MMCDEIKSFVVEVTRCTACPHKGTFAGGARNYCPVHAGTFIQQLDVYEQNKDGLTETCPIWAKENR